MKTAPHNTELFLTFSTLVSGILSLVGHSGDRPCHHLFSLAQTLRLLLS